MAPDDDKDLPQSDAARSGGSAGALGDAVEADLERGYTDRTPGAAQYDPMNGMEVVDFQDSEDGEPGPDLDDMVQPGFLGRPNGYER